MLDRPTPINIDIVLWICVIILSYGAVSNQPKMFSVRIFHKNYFNPSYYEQSLIAKIKSRNTSYQKVYKR